MELYKADQKNEEIFKLNGIDYIFYTRLPNTEDKIKYMAEAVKKENGKISDKYESTFRAKYKCGCELVTGFPETFPDGNPQFEYKGKPISSDPKSANYNEDWKELILPNFLNQIIIFSTKVYDGIDLKEKLDKALETANKNIIEETELDEESPLESSSLQR